MRSLALEEGREEGGSRQAGWNHRPHEEQSAMPATQRLVQQLTHLDTTGARGVRRGGKGGGDVRVVVCIP